MFQPDISKVTMCIVIDDFDSPSYRIGGGVKWAAVCYSGYRRTKSFRIPRINLRFALFNIQ